MSNTIAAMVLCNTASFNIYEITEDYIIGGINDLFKRKYKLYYCVDGRAYFIYKGIRYHLNEFMSV